MTHIATDTAPRAPTQRKRKPLPLIIAVLSGTLATSGIAEDLALEEVLVTATKRGASSIQDIPYNISAVGGSFLEQAGVDDFAEIARVVPGLELVDGGPNNKQFVIRGLAGDSGAAQTSVYIDEVPFSFGQTGNVRQSEIMSYDLERVEVLRGPQGTLYGEGSQGGTIRYITRKPDLSEFSGSARVTVAEASRDGGTRLSADGMLNLPLVKDTFGLRAVVSMRDNDGLVDRPDLGFDGSDEEDSDGARLHALWNIGDNTSLQLSYFTQQVEVADTTRVGVDEDEVPGFVVTPFEDDWDIYNLTFNHRFDFGAVTFSGSEMTRETLFSFDVSQFTPFPSRVTQPRELDITSFELRFASDFDGPLQFIAGAYYNEQDGDGLSFGAPVDPETGEVPTGYPAEEYFFALRTLPNTETKSLFGELTYQLTDKLSLLAGIRAFEFTEDTAQYVEVEEDIFGRPRGLINELKSKDEDEVFKLQASYQLNDDVLLYATWSEGFRQGGPNAPFEDNPDLPTSYGPDYVDNYELGWKSEWMDRQLVLNGALYFMTWDDIQVSLVDSTGANDYVDNYGEADLYGLELEAVYRPEQLSGLTLSLGFNLSNQELTEDSPSQATGEKGDPIPNTIENSASLGIEQRFTLFGLDNFARLDVAYTGEAQTTFSSADAQYREWGDFTIVNLRWGVDAEHWSLSLFAKNLTDEREPMSWLVQDRPGIPDQIQTTRPRTVGLTASINF
jgi:outer membrane receptor protein involved in Fe transport